jgi:hypothetical protein
MAKKKKRTPKKGDRVTTTLHQGTFAIYSVDQDLRPVDLVQIGSDLRLASVPWRSIKFLSYEGDFSQAAPRIVREATKD